MAKKKQEEEQKESVIAVIKELAKERGIDEEVLIKAIEEGIVAAFRREFSSSKNTDNVFAEINRDNGEIFVYKLVEVVEEVEDPDNQISFADAKAMDDTLELGDEIEVGIDVDELGRLAATAAKSAISQKVREAEYARIQADFSGKINEIASGVVQRKDNRYVYVDIARAEAVLPKEQQIKGENYEHGRTMKFLVLNVQEYNGRPTITVSRTHVDLVRKLFELEVPEIKSGEVIIKSVSREPGSRSKVAVCSRDENIDAKGACVGQRGQRVQEIMRELGGEKIDIIDWSEDEAAFITEALQPANVSSVSITYNPKENGHVEKKADVVVPDSQYSLAIGRAGQNVRLAARLTGFKIDIKTESAAAEHNVNTLVNEFTVVESDEEGKED